MGYMISRLRSIGYHYFMHAAFPLRKTVTDLLKKCFPHPFKHFPRRHRLRVHNPPVSWERWMTWCTGSLSTMMLIFRRP